MRTLGILVGFVCLVVLCLLVASHFRRTRPEGVVREFTEKYFALANTIPTSGPSEGSPPQENAVAGADGENAPPLQQHTLAKSVDLLRPYVTKSTQEHIEAHLLARAITKHFFGEIKVGAIETQLQEAGSSRCAVRIHAPYSCGVLKEALDDELELILVDGAWRIELPSLEVKPSEK